MRSHVSGNVRRVLKIIRWNLLFILVGLLLIGIAGEVYWRLNGRFGNVIINLGSDYAYWRLEPGVGLLRPPQSDLTFSNGLDYWTVQHSNSLGFMDREPIDPDRAAESCHITIIGDSFVEAQEVPVSDKLQVRLEEMAAREAPHLDVTTSAFGIQRTGQVNQLALYDRYARGMSPDMIVLVFVGNDLVDNSTDRYTLAPGHVPRRLPYGQAARDVNGGIRWFPPVVDFDDAVFSDASESLNSWRSRAVYRVASASYFMRWLGVMTKLIGANDSMYKWFLADEDSVRRYQEWMHILLETMPMGDEIEVWGFTSLGLEQFKRRADHDGAVLMVLTVYRLGDEGNLVFNRLSAIGQSLGIPVINQHDYIVRQGGNIEDARFNHDGHWSPAGHLWAAEAIWEHIEEEWDGKCPEVEPRPDIEVDWVAVEEPLDDVGYEDTIQTLQVPFGLRHWIYTSEGKAWMQSFPAIDSEEYRSVYESVTSGDPVMRSDWDVHLYDNGLTYVKEPCAIDDVENRFFLHVFREDENGALPSRQSIVSENLDFHFGIRGVAFEGSCMVSVDLPDYDVVSIRTGQFIKNVDSSSEVWSARYNFALPEIVEFLQKLQQYGRDPDIKASFNVYLVDDRLIYVKESCSTDDRDLPFFLHVIPADEMYLADGREESGFNNLGFELIHKGGMHDGGCFAAVDLPTYEIARIRTGQWVRGEGNVWEASIELGE